MKNMGTIDRLLRLIVVVGVAVAWYLGRLSGTVGLVLEVVAVVFLLTSLISFCPLYKVIGLSTAAKD